MESCLRCEVPDSKFLEGPNYRPGIDRICEMVEAYKGAYIIGMEIRQFEIEFKMREGF